MAYPPVTPAQRAQLASILLSHPVLGEVLRRIARPNRVQITEAIYRSKWVKWQRRWDGLTVVPW